MGRAKILIKRIEDTTNRQVTFCRRRTGLLKKARELATLCDAQVAAVVVSSSGRVYDYASSVGMKRIVQACNLSNRTNNVVDEIDLNTDPCKSQSRISDSIEYELHLQVELERLEKDRRLWEGNIEDLESLPRKEIMKMEAQMEKTLRKIQKRKFEVICEEIEDLKKKQRQLETENHELRRHIRKYVSHPSNH